MKPPPRKIKCFRCGSLKVDGRCTNEDCHNHVRNMLCIVHCAKCGKGLTLGSGYNALHMGRAKQAECLLKKGWTVAPRMLCHVCSSPLSAMEIAEYRSLDISLKKMKMETALVNKYGKIVHKFFQQERSNR